MIIHIKIDIFLHQIDGFMMNSYIELFLNDDGLLLICYW